MPLRVRDAVIFGPCASGGACEILPATVHLRCSFAASESPVKFIQSHWHGPASRWVVVGAVFCLGAIAGVSRAGEAAAGAAPQKAQESAAQENGGASTATPQNGAANMPQTQAYSLPPERAAQAIAYARARHQLYFLDFAYSVLVLLMLLRWRVAPAFRDWAERSFRSRLGQAAIFAPALLLTLGVLGLPGDVASQWLARHFAQSIQGWGSWFWDWSKGELAGAFFGVFLVWLFYAVVRRSPRGWWFYAWLGAVPIIVFVVFVSPLVIEPMFFRFGLWRNPIRS